MRFLTVLITVALFSVGCEKFVHQDVEVIVPPCELCDWADSLEGEYAGNYTYYFANYMGQHDTIDSLNFIVQHVFLNKGPLVDSTQMFFDVSWSGGNFTSAGSLTWIADDSTQFFRHTGFDQIWMDKDSLTLNDGYSVPFFGGSYSYISKNGVFYRQ